MVLEVCVQVTSLGKSLTTDVTGEPVLGIIWLMDQFVGPQNSLSFESFLASFAFECFLELVDQADMVREMVLREVLGANLALPNLTELE